MRTPVIEQAADLPIPDATAAARSAALAGHIRGRIEAHGGSIGFDAYMQLCLYAPGLGYYSAGQAIFGRQGDFITAPEVSPLFGACVATPCADVLAELCGGDILEFGAGSGRLALDVLTRLHALGQLPQRYRIVELSAALRERQRETLSILPIEIRQRVQWLDELPAPGLRGVVLANEVLDAMPVRIFRRGQAGWLERRVCISGEGFGWMEQAADEALADTLQQRAASLDEPLPIGYRSELNPWIAPWMRSLAGMLEAGALLLFDYGYPRREYYLPERGMGTLLCHYRHRVHDDPFLYPGLQDITASVDFTAVAEAGVGEGLELMGYTSQALFLIGTGIGERLAELQDLAALQACKRLLLPNGMGERFQVMALGRGLDRPLRGFAEGDRRHRL